jgi:hypothetical protein
VPAARVEISTDTFWLEGVVLEKGLTLSQGVLLVTLLVKVIGLPVLLMLSVLLAGLAPPCVAVKLRLVGLTTRLCWVEFTVKVIGTLTGGVFTENGERVMVAL